SKKRMIQMSARCAFRIVAKSGRELAGKNFKLRNHFAMKNVSSDFARCRIEQHYNLRAVSQLKLNVLRKKRYYRLAKLCEELHVIKSFRNVLVSSFNCIDKQSPRPTDKTDQTLIIRQGCAS